MSQGKNLIINLKTAMMLQLIWDWKKKKVIISKNQKTVSVFVLQMEKKIKQRCD